MDQRKPEVLFLRLHPLCLETRCSLAWSSLIGQGWPVSPRNSHISTSHALGFQARGHDHSFCFVLIVGPGIGLGVVWHGALSPEPSLSPQIDFELIKIVTEKNKVLFLRFVGGGVQFVVLGQSGTTMIIQKQQTLFLG